MSAAGSDDAATLRAMIAGYEAAQALYVAAKLDLADLVARGDDVQPGAGGPHRQ